MPKKKSISSAKTKPPVKKKAIKKVSVKTQKEKALQKQAGYVVRGLQKKFPNVTCALNHTNPYQLLCATILSAQCRDERVNQYTPALFKKYPTPEKLALGKQKDVEKLVKSLGFFRAKAKNLIGMGKGLVERHDGQVPADLNALVNLPGVGRKTANVILGTWFKIPSGVVVDTHVKRICKLLGLTKSQNPEIVERELMKILPEKEWIDFSHRIVFHGRETCIARRPQCDSCVLLKHCPRIGLPELD